MGEVVSVVMDAECPPDACLCKPCAPGGAAERWWNPGRWRQGPSERPLGYWECDPKDTSSPLPVSPGAPAVPPELSVS